MPAVRPGWASASSSRALDSRRAAAQGPGRVVRLGAGHPEDAQRPVALELVDPAALRVDRPHHHVEEVVERLHHLVRRQHLGHGGRAHEVDEHDAGVGLLAPQARAPLQRLGGDLVADVPPEQVADLAALPQAVDHLVEPGLHLADLAPVVDHQPDVEVAVPDAAEGVADAVERLGHRPGRRHGGDEPGGQAGEGQGGQGVRRGSRRRRSGPRARWPAAARRSPPPRSAAAAAAPRACGAGARAGPPAPRRTAAGTTARSSGRRARRW